MLIDLEGLTDEGTLAVFLYENAFSATEVVESLQYAFEALPNGAALPEAQCGAVSAIMGMVYLTQARDTDPAQHGPVDYLEGMGADNLQHAIEHGNTFAVSLIGHSETAEAALEAAYEWVMDRVTVPDFSPADIFAV